MFVCMFVCFRVYCMVMQFAIMLFNNLPISVGGSFCDYGPLEILKNVSLLQ